MSMGAIDLTARPMDCWSENAQNMHGTLVLHRSRCLVAVEAFHTLSSTSFLPAFLSESTWPSLSKRENCQLGSFFDICEL